MKLKNLEIHYKNNKDIKIRCDFYRNRRNKVEKMVLVVLLIILFVFVINNEKVQLINTILQLI